MQIVESRLVDLKELANPRNRGFKRFWNLIDVGRRGEIGIEIDAFRLNSTNTEFFNLRDFERLKIGPRGAPTFCAF